MRESNFGFHAKCLKESFCHNKTDAFRRPACARIFSVIHEVVSVIKCDFFPSLDVALCDEPKVTAIPFYFTIWRATVVDITRRVPIYIAIQIFSLV